VAILTTGSGGVRCCLQRVAFTGAGDGGALIHVEIAANCSSTKSRGRRLSELGSFNFVVVIRSAPPQTHNTTQPAFASARRLLIVFRLWRCFGFPVATTAFKFDSSISSFGISSASARTWVFKIELRYRALYEGRGPHFFHFHTRPPPLRCLLILLLPLSLFLIHRFHSCFTQV
jgi:hypothetical protein